MSILVASDLHLTINPMDEYRWGLLPWIETQIKKHNVKAVALLGDLTDAKDRHPSILVNKLVDRLSRISTLAQIIIIRGNHDYVDEDSPFFKFLRHTPRVFYVTEPAEWSDYLFLPHTRDWEKDWKPYLNSWNDYKIIFTHQTYDGALAENGQTLRGIPPSVFKGFKGQVISGDIHVPQRLSRRLLYVGAPYHIKFGDDFSPRVLLVRERGNDLRDLTFKTVSRKVASIRNLQELRAYDYNSGDQVKVKVRLKRSEFPEGPKLRKEIKKLAKERGWALRSITISQIKSKTSAIDKEVQSIDPSDVLLGHAKRKKLDKSITDIGLKLLEEAKGA